MGNSSNVLAINDKEISVLVVEDNLVNQKVLLVLLERLGLSAHVTNNGKEALDAVGKEKFSLILMDCHMPEMDGFEATAAIRKLETQAGTYTPIIAVTALAMAGDRERCIAAGMDDYLSKPINKEMLQVKLAHWLRADVVYRSQKLSRTFLRPHCEMTLLEKEPINLADLLEFYGEDQMNQILAIFQENTEQALKRIKFFLKEQDSKTLAGLAHELKASCASIGAKQLTKLSLFLEQAAGQQDWLEVEETLRSFNKSFEYLQDYIEQSLPSKMPAANT